MRNLLIFSILLINFSNLGAQICVKGDCYNGFGTLISNSKSRYTGEFKGGKMQGRGIMYYAKGGKYIGEWLNGRRHGEGEWFQANGNIYQGHFENDRPEGFGTMTFKNNDKYMGQWKQELPNGRGTYYLANGERYEGEFQNGNYAGLGIYYFKDGSVYKGQWYNGKKEGIGELKNAAGKIVSGQWSDDKQVKIISEQESKPSPKPVLKQSEAKPEDQMSHEDSVIIFSDDMVAIQKVDTTKSKPEIELDLSELETEINKETKVDTKIESTEKIKTENTKLKIQETAPQDLGELRDCSKEYCKNGKGVLLYTDGSKYVGEFLNGEPHGKGICYYINGDRYEGNWDNHAPHGEGVMYFHSGLVYGAIWEHGNAVKQLMSKNEFIFDDKVAVEKSAETKIWAVIVGISKYEHMPSLKYSDDDAYKIYAFLKSPEGGALKDNQIKLFIDEDATRVNLLRGMNELFMKADENDMIVFYYSGHGLEGSFLPIDYDGFANAIQHDEIKNMFNKSHAKYKVCYADACHSGSLLAAKSPYSSSLLYFYEDLNNASGGTAFLMSSKDKEYSLEDGGLRQGIFSHYLIKGLAGEADADKNYIVTISELYKYVNGHVKEYTANAQTPLIAGDYDEQMPVSFVRK